MVQSRCLILIMLLPALGCSKATPTFDLLDQDAIPRPMFNGSSVKDLQTTSDTEEFTITGQCDRKITSMSALAVGIATSYSDLNSVSVTPATVTCASTGTFSFKLKSLSALGFTVAENTIYKIQIRGMTSAGNSKPSFINIRYSSPVGKPHLLLSGGGVHGGGEDANRMSSTNFKAEVRMNHLTQPVTSSVNFTLKAGTAARN